MHYEKHNNYYKLRKILHQIVYGSWLDPYHIMLYVKKYKVMDGSTWGL